MWNVLFVLTFFTFTSGLPHIHILLWIKGGVQAADIDKLISAEIPDKDKDPILFDIVTSQMVHGPCGRALDRNAPCMQDGRCTKRYPRPFVAETQLGEDGYPAYKRTMPEHGGKTATIKMKNGVEKEIDNQWIVPYCPFLSKTFNAHINVEWVNSVKSIKYCCKYVNKGSDAAMFSLQQDNTRNEVDLYQMGRYISTNEAIWRFLQFPIHERYPSVQQLSVHLENGQRVYFTEANARQVAQNPKDSTLMAFFRLCQADSFARTLLYHQVPSYYTWKGNKWSPRKKGQSVPGYPAMRKDDTLGRVYTVHPNQQECFFLRILLHEVKGPRSFQDLKTYDGHEYATYREACRQRGLLEDDAQWEATLNEAKTSVTAPRMRSLFAMMLAYSCEISDPLRLWMLFREDFSDDFLREARILGNNMTLDYSDAIFNKGLIALEKKVLELGGQLLQNYGLPIPDRESSDGDLSREVLRETSYDINELNEYTATNEPKLLEEQRRVYNTLLGSVQRGKGGMFFLDAPGGTGKTFVTSLLLAKVRQQNKIALAVASTGIASCLLPGGRTAHAMFKLPLDLSTNQTPTCNIKKGSGLAEVLKRTALIVWDECTMTHKAAFESVDRTLRDLRNRGLLMGGVTVVLSGDFRQCLPVVQRGTAADELRACLKASRDIWPQVKQLKLTKNMRAHLYGDANADTFAKSLLRLGDGKVPTDKDGLIDMSPISTPVTNLNELKEKVFPNFEAHYKDRKWLNERAILAPKNATVNRVNDEMMQKIPAPTRLYKSIDTVVDDSEAVDYPVEFLNSLELPGTPSHNLKLKEGAPIMLLRNLDPPKLCNGTKLVVKKLHSHLIEATILNGTAAGEDVCIPRIPMIPNDLPFRFKRLQFPVKPCFAMSINKSQGDR